MLSDLLRYQAEFDGHTAQRYFSSHPMLPTITIGVYLLMVRYGTRWMSVQPAYDLRTVSLVWNLSIALFSVCGASVCVPHLLSVLYEHGFWYSACADIYELAGYGAPAFWASLFTWSKIFELFDTMLLILKKRSVITLHWFHHASVIGFAWCAWVYETPCALWYGAMNYSVHTVMYSYFSLMSVSSIRSSVSSVAPLITALQIMQFAMGTVVNIFAGVAWALPGVGCSIHPVILQIAAALYIAYGMLFLKLFIDRYIVPRRSCESPRAVQLDALKSV